MPADEGFTVGPLFRGARYADGGLVDEDGRIASEMAVGAPAVLALARGAGER
ncbi:hypothetical protein ABGB17_01800 [Sphaerisporangium sp. B11E5]|uniref:hypothetical protein n=1 Tax=Sphaerisporangium sp. B11E5 TaxID=3153563 RepID=UPI00325E4CFC